MIRNAVSAVLIALLALGLAGCKTAKAGDRLARQPIDCSTAEADIAALRAEEANAAERFADGVTSIIPVGAVIHILGLNERGDLEIAIGSYNRMLKDKIREIQEQCGVD